MGDDRTSKLRGDNVAVKEKKQKAYSTWADMSETDRMWARIDPKMHYESRDDKGAEKVKRICD